MCCFGSFKEAGKKFSGRCAQNDNKKKSVISNHVGKHCAQAVRPA